MPATLTLPGLIDAHVHLREPGATHKEDSFTGTRAALAGGFTTILDMPNNQPPPSTPGNLDFKQTLFSAKAVCDYGMFAGYEPAHHADLAALASRTVGLKLYLDATFANSALLGDRLEPIFRDWPGPGPIAVHAESASIPLALELAQRYRQHLHVCHVPHPDDLLVIDQARQAGAHVTCEVTPHHLFLTTDDARRLGAFGVMKPPLLAPDLVALFWLRLPLIDIIASDHAPHTKLEKTSDAPPPGVPGLETTLALLLQAVDAGRLTIERLQQLLHSGPAGVYNLHSDTGTVEVELVRHTLPADGYLSRCGWSPFAGKQALGIVHDVTLHGNLVWHEGRLLAKPGSGRDVVKQRLGQA